MAGGYKQAKEAFVSGTIGSTITHVNLTVAVGLASVALNSALRTRIPPTRSIHFSVAWIILVVPMLLAMTTFANSPGLLSVMMLVPTGLLLMIPKKESGSPLPSTIPSTPSPASRRASGSYLASQQRARNQMPILPSLTTYRAHMMLITILAILAVDFQVFPRALAKCETYGVSLMDTGVGSFVFSQGVVAAIPLLRDPAYLTGSLSRKVISVSWKNLPVLVLGLIRVLLVKGTDYPEHVSEYGAHWNFFITLAIVPVLQVLLHPIIQWAPISLVGVAIAAVHQLALSYGGLEVYILFEPRGSIISANKEGLISTLGYLAIHMLGLSIGTLILPPSPSFFRRRQKQSLKQKQKKRRLSDAPNDADKEIKDTFGVHRENDKTAIELFSYSTLWWAFLGITKLTGVGSPTGSADISRRMANLPYVLWIAAINTMFLLGYLLVDLYFFPSPLLKTHYDPNSKLKSKVPPPPSHQIAMEGSQHVSLADVHPNCSPPLLDAVNKNSLVLFLIANAATGLINLTVQTMYVSDRVAMGILSGYAFSICLVAWLFRDRRIIQL
ncbi:GWT1-domain-containing protein [Pluteus cervinus]|uniref:GWT1-domain-containing protein n=1 Tax=Pluteus cervinus TaxID=181527 RepID=A0ACD3AVX2_9AGAR|nr:GWT1-domain-containing protein [Pluteus cervinus]